MLCIYANYILAKVLTYNKNQFDLKGAKGSSAVSICPTCLRFWIQCPILKTKWTKPMETHFTK